MYWGAAAHTFSVSNDRLLSHYGEVRKADYSSLRSEIGEKSYFERIDIGEKSIFEYEKCKSSC